jgi:hypothetical protein
LLDAARLRNMEDRNSGYDIREGLRRPAASLPRHLIQCHTFDSRLRGRDW